MILYDSYLPYPRKSPGLQSCSATENAKAIVAAVKPWDLLLVCLAVM